MKRLIVLAMCAWPVVAMGQSDGKMQALLAASGHLYPIAQAAGSAVSCGLKTARWEEAALSGMGDEILNTSRALYGNDTAPNAEDAFDAASAHLGDAAWNGGLIKPSGCQSLFEEPLSGYIKKADSYAAEAVDSGWPAINTPHSSQR